MTEPAIFHFETEKVRNKGYETTPLWYLMRIVGNKSDILVQAVLDALLYKSPDEQAETKQPSKAEVLLLGLGDKINPADIERYVYPKVVLQNIKKNTRERFVSPLLTGYIFCRATEDLLVHLVNTIPNFIFCYPRPINETKRIVIREAEMDMFIQALEKASQDHNIQVIPYEQVRSMLKNGTHVRLEGGTLHGLDGILGDKNSKNHLYITIGGRFTVDIKLKRTDKVQKKPIGVIEE